MAPDNSTPGAADALGNTEVDEDGQTEKPDPPDGGPKEMEEAEESAGVEPNASERTLIIFSATGAGIDCGFSGTIFYVWPGTLADKKGVQIGDYITHVNGEEFSYPRLVRAESLARYNMTIVSGWKEPEPVRMLGRCVSMLAGLLGFGLLFGIVFAMPPQRNLSPEWRPGRFEQILCSRVTFAIFVLEACLWTARGLAMFWLLPGKWIHAAGGLAQLPCCAGLVAGLAAGLQTPLLGKRLTPEAWSVLRRQATFAWLVCVAALAAGTGIAFDNVKAMGQFEWNRHKQNVCLWVSPLSLLITLEFILVVSRIAAAVEAHFDRLVDELPCKAAEFRGRVHDPLVQFLKEVEPQLRALGPPILLVSIRLAYEGVSVYNEIRFFGIGSYKQCYLWSQICLSTIHFATAVLACAGGAWRLSFASESFRRKLHEAERSDPDLAEQVDAAERLLEKANDGGGWGIPVSGMFVINKDSLISIMLKLTVVATAVNTFLDEKLGFNAKQHSMEEQLLALIGGRLSKIEHVLSNTSKPLP